MGPGIRVRCAHIARRTGHTFLSGEEVEVRAPSGRRWIVWVVRPNEPRPKFVRHTATAYIPAVALGRLWRSVTRQTDGNVEVIVADDDVADDDVDRGVTRRIANRASRAAAVDRAVDGATRLQSGTPLHEV